MGGLGEGIEGRGRGKGVRGRGEGGLGSVAGEEREGVRGRGERRREGELRVRVDMVCR